LNISAEQQKKLNECVDAFSRGVSITCGVIEKP
jgi:hypothetical protein